MAINTSRDGFVYKISDVGPRALESSYPRVRLDEVAEKQALGDLRSHTRLRADSNSSPAQHAITGGVLCNFEH